MIRRLNLTAATGGRPLYVYYVRPNAKAPTAQLHCQRSAGNGPRRKRATYKGRRYRFIIGLSRGVCFNDAHHRTAFYNDAIARSIVERLRDGIAGIRGQNT